MCHSDHKDLTEKIWFVRRLFDGLFIQRNRQSYNETGKQQFNNETGKQQFNNKMIKLSNKKTTINNLTAYP